MPPVGKQALIQGAYVARSYIANAQRCVNLYIEQNPPDAPFPTTHYPTPGLISFATPGTSGPNRGQYRATNGNAFTVVGDTVYMVTSAGVMTAVGTMATATGQCSMIDNGAYVLLVDGTATGYLFTVSGGSFSTIMGGNFYGATRVDYLDGYFILNQPGTRSFYISLFNSTAFDSLDIASKLTYPDLLVASVVLGREIWQIGQFKTEVWYNTGASDFTFGRMPGVAIDMGCNAAFSIAKASSALFWLAQDLNGHAQIVMGESYKVQRISTFAIEEAIRKYERIDDAVGYCYQQAGHTFYVLTFPSADATWVYDVGVSQVLGYPVWHQRGWSDENGVLHRQRPLGHMFAHGYNLVGDWQTGEIYRYDLESYTDDGDAVQRIRSFPHIKNHNRMVSYNWLMAEFDVGHAPGRLATDPVEVWLRWSDDGGASWGDPVTQSAGATGQFNTRIKWAPLGMGFDRVFELGWSHDAKTALNGADVDPEAADA